MTRAEKPLGDLEYEKFDGDTGAVKVQEQSAINYTEFQKEQIMLLKEVIRLQNVQISYFKNFFIGDIIDGGNWIRRDWVL